MAEPSSRSDFKEYILRKLGSPVIEINVSDEQIEDRIDEALSFYADYHYDGTEHVYLKHVLTAEDIRNKYITLPPKLQGVVGVVDLKSNIASGSSLFNVRYQYILNNIQDLQNYDISNYYISMQHLELIEEVLTGKEFIRYNKNINKLHIDVNSGYLSEGSVIVIEAYDTVDGSVNADLWKDRWLQNYAAILVKQQWGSNLTKFTNLQLMAGIQFNGEQILSEATAEREKVEEEAKQSLQSIIQHYSG